MALLCAGLLVVVPGAPVTADAATGPDCGATVLKPDGTAWRCTFADDFSTDQLDPTKWTPQLTATSGYHSGPECFVDTPQNINVSGGELRLTLLKLKNDITCGSGWGSYRTSYTSGMVSTYTKFTQARGRFEIRAKFPGGNRAGLQSSLWMWPQTLDPVAWPYSGEIDVAEWYSQYPTRAVPYIHYQYDFLDPAATNNNCVVGDVADYHTYAVEWTADAITISYDGKVCTRSTTWTFFRNAGYAPFDKPFMLAITQMLGVGGNAINPWAPPTFPATTTVDYVHVWS